MKTAGQMLHLSPLNWVSNENGPLACFKLDVFPLKAIIYICNGVLLGYYSIFDKHELLH